MIPTKGGNYGKIYHQTAVHLPADHFRAGHGHLLPDEADSRQPLYE